jgi:hypothetical protein
MPAALTLIVDLMQLFRFERKEAPEVIALLLLS